MRLSAPKVFMTAIYGDIKLALPEAFMLSWRAVVANFKFAGTSLNLREVTSMLYVALVRSIWLENLISDEALALS